MDTTKTDDSFPPVLPLIRRLFQSYSAARKQQIADQSVREGVRDRYLILKECMRGFFPPESIDIPSMGPSTKANCVRELGALGILLQQSFGLHFWFHLRGRTGTGEAVTIRRKYFDGLEVWLQTTGMSVALDGDNIIADEENSAAGKNRGNIDAYFAAAEANLWQEFQQRRLILTDSDAKGGANERAVGDFLQKHVGAARIALNKQVIDSHSMTSREMDVCVCNINQPSVDIPLIFAEGVDFVVQVKAILTDAELPRIVKNCESLKRLERRFSIGDEIFARPEEIPFVVGRIPYFVLAFESTLSLHTLKERLLRLLEEELPVHWPDGLFVLDQGAIQHIQFADGSSMRTTETGDNTMVKFLQQIHSVAHNSRRLRSPLIYYFPTDMFYPR